MIGDATQLMGATRSALAAIVLIIALPFCLTYIILKLFPKLPVDIFASALMFIGPLLSFIAFVLALKFYYR